jgi:hypothetical protein
MVAPAGRRQRGTPSAAGVGVQEGRPAAVHGRRVQLAKVSGIGASKKDKRDSEAAELTYMPLPDGYFMAMVDGVYRPILRHTWVGGLAGLR